MIVFGRRRLSQGLAVSTMFAVLAACGDARAPQNGSITQEKLSADLHVLAHDSMGGRLVGSQELGAASDWIAGRFEELGLEGAGDGGGYFQSFDLMCPHARRVTAGPSRARAEPRFHKRLWYSRASASSSPDSIMTTTAART